MNLSHMKPSRVDIALHLARFLSSAILPLFALFTPRGSAKEVFQYLSSVWRQLLLGIALLFIKKEAKRSTWFSDLSSCNDAGK